MAAIEDLIEESGALGPLAAGVGLLLLAPVVAPAVVRALRPAAKGAIKGYLAVSGRVREQFAEAAEEWQDVLAEARSEYGTAPEEPAAPEPEAPPEEPEERPTRRRRRAA